MSTITQASPVIVRRQRVTFVVQSLHCDRCNREMVKKGEYVAEGITVHNLPMHEYRCPVCGASLITPTEYPHSHREVEIP
jgi:transposase-like protein